MPVRARCCAAVFRRLLPLLAMLWGIAGAVAETKFIRLRTELIPTEPPPKRAALPQALVADTPVAGLYLIQFTNHLETAWRDPLRANGVALLHYVPDDTFVAHVKDVRLST